MTGEVGIAAGEEERCGRGGRREWHRLRRPGGFPAG
jgi:hypothetical protein